MGNPAVDRSKREMVLKALQKLAGGETLTRAQIFTGYDEHKELQKKVLASLKVAGAIKKIQTNNPSVVLFTSSNPDMLRSIARSDGEVTRLIWPSAAPAISELTPQPEVEDPENPEEPEPSPGEAMVVAPAFPPPPNPRSAMSTDSEVKEMLKEIRDRQDLLLEKVIGPIVENLIWTRDRVRETQEAVNRMLEILKELE